MSRLVVVAWLCLVAGAASAADATVAELEGVGVAVKMRGAVPHELRVDCDKMTAEGWQTVARATWAKAVFFDGKQLTDEHLAMLSGFKQLESFSLNGSVLTDAGYRHFTQFPALKKIALWHPSRRVDGFTGSGLRELRALPKLESLTFAGATAGDVAYEAIAELTQLTSFREWHNLETAAGMKALTKLPNLKSLVVGQRLHSRDNPEPSFTGAFLDDVVAMKSLESLELKEARLRFDDLVKLKQLPNLKRLKLHQVAIPPAEVDRLKEALPGVVVDWTPLSPADEEKFLVKKLRI